MKDRGHKPVIQGGKGRGLTRPQKQLFAMLGPAWTPEMVIKTGLPKRDGNATWYSADLAHAGLKLCVEIDGGSHKTLEAQARDARRNRILSQLGWTTLRFSNNDILRNMNAVIAKIESTISKLKEMKTTSPKAF